MYPSVQETCKVCSFVFETASSKHANSWALSDLRFKILLHISQFYKVNKMRCNYYNSYYIHALIKQRNKRNGSTQSCIFDPSSKHQTLDAPFTRGHMHTSDTDTNIHMSTRTATYMKNQNQASTLICHVGENIIHVIYAIIHYYTSVCNVKC